MRKLSLILLATIVSTLIYITAHGEVASGLAILGFVAVLWLTEAIHVSATALLVPVLAVSLQVLTVREALENFANPIIYLFMGGFALAGALRAQDIDRWLANKVIVFAKGRVDRAIYYLFGTTAFVSMWISNTATTAMMLPVVLGLLKQMNSEVHKNTLIFVLLGVAYSANVGGIGTLVGSPPNAIAASELEMSFADWLKFGMPLVIVLLPLLVLALHLIFKPTLSKQQDQRLLELHTSLQWTAPRIAVLTIFGSVVTLWLLSSQLALLLGIETDFDAFVGLLAVVVLLGSGLLPWRTFDETTDWGVLLLFGGGITLSAVLSATGTSQFLAETMVATFAQVPGWIFLLMAITLIVFLTELASNTASAALLVPIFYSLPAEQFGIAPEILAIAIAIGASCAFMLPVATPPNALVFGTGLVPQKQMIRAGIWLNLSCIGVITLVMVAFNHLS